MDSHTAALLTLIVQFITQVKVNGFSAWLIQQLKLSESKWLTWIAVNTPWMSRVIATITAALTGVGINLTFTGNWSAGSISWAGVTAIGVLTAAGHMLWTIGQNYLIQHAWYKAAFKG